MFRDGPRVIHYAHLPYGGQVGTRTQIGTIFRVYLLVGFHILGRRHCSIIDELNNYADDVYLRSSESQNIRFILWSENNKMVGVARFELALCLTPSQVP